jgi:hypothetical protein
LKTIPDSSTRFLLWRLLPVTAAPRSPDAVSQSGGNGAAGQYLVERLAEFRPSPFVSG